MGLSTLAELADIPEMDKQVYGVLEPVKSLGKTTRTAMESSQVMAQFRIIPFDREGLRLVEHGLVGSSIVIDIGIGRESITEVTVGVRTLVHDCLEGLEGALCPHRMAHNAPGSSIYCCDDVHLVFFCPTNV